MIIVKIMGGLGNQLFTYSAAYALAQKTGNELLLDQQIYHTFYSLRSCQLCEFGIDYRESILNKSLGHNKAGRKLYRILLDYKLKKYRAEKIEEQEEFAQQEFYIKPGHNYHLEGYWQNYRYFNEFRKDLRRQFVPLHISAEAQKMAERAKEECPTAMHIRRSDYKTFKGGKCLSPEYYVEGLRKLDAIQNCRESDAKRTVWIFTDDIEFCKAQFCENPAYGSTYRFVCVGEEAVLSDIEEFWLMSLCTDFIIANSSFSWWAAYLSEEENKIVVAPVVDMWKESFYLPDWNLINASLEK